MPLTTDFSVSPFFDDIQIAEKNHYYKILFQPAVSVQTRELNQLQTLLQRQIERFGDNIYQSGTIISGCNFGYDPQYSYIKIKDLDNTGLPTIPSQYVGLYATSKTTGVKAYIKNSLDGFEATDPNLKTLYVDYIRSGSNAEGVFAAGELVRISDPLNTIWNVNINAPGSTYSNSDSAVFVSAISVNAVVGAGFQVGETISQSGANTRATVVSVNNTIYSDRSVIFISPYATDLGNTNLVSTPWVIANTLPIIGGTTNTTATVIDIIGAAAAGQVITDGAGRIVDIVVTNPGNGYRLPPYATVKPASNPSAITTGLSLTALNYLQDIYVATTANSTGFGYAMQITKGIVYQKGYFIDVVPQTVIVSNYSPVPNNLSVIFQTAEQIVTSDVDPSLLDNAMGSPNYTAPGAARVQLIPYLAVVNTDFIQTQTDTVILSSFSEGQAWRQNQYTQFDSINDELARRTREEAGDYVIDPFKATTRSPVSNASIANVSLIVDPGVAYVDGYRVEISRNFSTDISKGVTTTTAKKTSVALAYDSYLRVKELGGLFKFNIGDTVSFYDAAKKYVSNTTNIFNSNTASVGNLVATASMRSLVLESGTPGTNNAIYRLYVFNMSSVAGKNFGTAKSVYYTNSGQAGIADIIQDYNASSTTYYTHLIGNASTLVFTPGVGRIQQVANVTYTYRSVNATGNTSNLGTMTVSLVANPNELFPYTASANLSSAQLQDLMVIPLANTLVGSVALTGTVTINSTSANMTGSGTTFTTQFMPGDFVVVANSTANDAHQIVTVANDTVAILEANGRLGVISGSAYRYYPPNLPVPFGFRSYLTANLSGNGAILTLNYGGRFAGSTNSNVAVTFNAQRSSVASGTKSAVRSNYIKISTANHVANSIGPWSIGVPDVVRMTGVWLVNSSANTPTGGTDVTSSFYIDNNETADLVGQGYLYKTPTSSLNLVNQYILVKFDFANTTIKGFYSTNSYTTANTTTVFATDLQASNTLGSTFSTWEIPEFNQAGSYYDMMQWVDFRPSAQTTANVAQVTLNPAASNTVSTASDWKFPVPYSTLTGDVTYYLGRIDTVVVDKKGAVSDIQGAPGVRPVAATKPKTSMLIDQFLIPPYPNIPQNPSAGLINAVTTFMGSGSINKTRVMNSIISSVANTAPSQTQQPYGYTMAHIGELERRIQALEYYVSLNSLETLVVQQAIPSSVSQSVNRFKYGFFADDFSTLDFANTSSPEWAATVYTDRDLCFPLAQKIPLHHTIQSHLSFVEYDYISQTIASVSSANTTNTVCNTVANTSVKWMQALNSGLDSSYGADYYKLTFSDTSVANCTIYHSNMTGGGGYENLYIDVYQNNVWVASATNNAVLVTNTAEIPPLMFSINQPMPDGSVPYVMIFLGWGPLNFYKITWNHDASKGTNYTIKTYAIKNPWRYVVNYPINSNNHVDCSNTGTTNSTSNGVTNTVSNTILWTNSISFTYGPGGHGYVSSVPVGQNAVGLNLPACKPSTTYSVFIGQQNVGAHCVPVGGNLGDALISDGTGVLKFTFYSTTSTLNSTLSIISPDPNVSSYAAYGIPITNVKGVIEMIVVNTTTGLYQATIFLDYQ